MSSTNIVLSVNEWNVSAIKYMTPKPLGDKGMKAVNLISSQTNRSLHVSTPLMLTWGISDFVDEKTGESDGKYSISLAFPNDEYRNIQTDTFLEKIKEFENKILDDAVKFSDLWFGESMSKEVLKHTFYPILKYSKNKETKKIDATRAPTFRAKVPLSKDGKWGIEIYDTKSSLIFPCSDDHLTPMDFVPKLSNVACVIQCGGLWIGAKGWGITWKLMQCVVKPREIANIYGKCHVMLSNEQRDNIETQEIPDEIDADEALQETVKQSTKPVIVEPLSTVVADSDDEAEPSVEVVPPVAPAPVKKIVKKAPEPVVVLSNVNEPVSEEKTVEPIEAPKKKVVKKKTT
jgi:hypothetical protein